jgi:putative hemolysin
MNGTDGLFIVLLFIALGCAAFFCSAETAFIGTQKLRLQNLIEKGDKRAKLVEKIMKRPEKFLATVLFGINFFETSVATLGTVVAISLWGENLGAVLATILVTLGTLVLAEFIPKSLAMRHGEAIALAYAKPIIFASYIFYPVVFLLNSIGIRFSKYTEEGGELKPTFSEEEVRTAINIGHREGAVETETAEMLHNVFEFPDKPVREVMAPRPEVIFIEKSATVGDFFELYAEHPVSRYPVYEGNRDNIVGILSVRDVLYSLAKGLINKESDLLDLVRPALFVPETKPIGELLEEMRQGNFRIAIVVDEFGGTAGVATFNQLVEEIVGPAGDGFSEAGKEFEIIDEHTFQIDGSMRIEEVNEEMGLGLPEGDYETVAGFILQLLRRIPKQDEQIKYKSLKIMIHRMSGVKIEEIMVTREKENVSAEAADTLTENAASPD